MTHAVTFHRLAELELTEASQYYEGESPGLGAVFLTDVERTVAFIVGAPESGAVAGGAIRRRLLHRFPYGVLYAVHENEIRILAIMNLKRRPGNWVGRT